jgi:hypothetical protein
VTALIGENRIPNRSSYTQAEAVAAKVMLQEGRSVANATASSTDDGIAAISKNPHKIAQIRLLIAREKLITQRTLIENRGLLPKDDVERAWVAKVLTVRARMIEIPLRASLIAMKDESECEKILTEWMSEICNQFAGEESDTPADRK